MGTIRYGTQRSNRSGKGMSEYQVQSNVAFPNECRGVRKYPFNKMEVGDSFAVEKENRHLCSNAASHHGRNHGKKFSVRKHGDEYRCWRIA